MSRIWAVIRLTISEALHTRVALAFVLLLVGVMVLLVSTASGDGTVSGKVQMFLSYSIGLIYFLLALLVIFLSCRSIDQDIKTMRIDSLVTKPIARWQLLAGRWAGTILLASGLLVISMSATYLITEIFARSVPAESKDSFKLHNQVLVARRSFTPPPIANLDAKIEEVYQNLKNEGRLPSPNDMPPSKVKQNIRMGLLLQPRTVGPRQIGTWKVTGLKPARQGSVPVTLIFKIEPSKTTSPAPKYGLHSNTILGYWIIGDRTSKRAYYWPPQGPREKPYRTKLQINVKTNVIAPDGSLTFSFVNIDPRGVAAHFPIKDGLEVLAREGGFTGNFIRTGLMVLISIIFLTTLSLACGTFLSFPIASLVTLSIFFIGMAGNFLSDAIGLPYGFEWTKSLIENIERAVTYASLQVIPVIDIGAYTSNLIDGRIVDWHDVLMKTLWLIVVDSGLLAIFAAIVFERRELGKITV